MEQPVLLVKTVRCFSNVSVTNGITCEVAVSSIVSLNEQNNQYLKFLISRLWSGWSITVSVRTGPSRPCPLCWSWPWSWCRPASGRLLDLCSTSTSWTTNEQPRICLFHVQCVTHGRQSNVSIHAPCCRTVSTGDASKFCSCYGRMAWTNAPTR